MLPCALWVLKAEQEVLVVPAAQVVLAAPEALEGRVAPGGPGLHPMAVMGRHWLRMRSSGTATGSSGVG
ncbi:hypothetical protein [Tardiphaga sp.]|uniref:hypothetical protein n=1 Tax=Tardiphaga sp. TaxID=1926292 RepID=UPI00352AF888